VLAASLDDEGAYSLHVRGSPTAAMSTSTFHLRVAVAPAVVGGIGFFSLGAGSTLELEATNATGAPPPACAWFYNGEEVPAGSGWGGRGTAVRLEVGQAGARGGRLIVQGLTAAHSGTYTATCTNAVGSVRWEEACVTVIESSRAAAVTLPPPQGKGAGISAAEGARHAGEKARSSGKRKKKKALGKK